MTIESNLHARAATGDQQMPEWVVRSLWVGGPMSELEWVCLNSFVCQGAQVELFTDDMNRPVPQGVRMRDCREVLPKQLPRFGPRAKAGQGSLAASADLARARTLFTEGGWWIDTDVVCLQSFVPIDHGMQLGYESPQGGPSGSGSVNVAVMRLPKQSEVGKHLYRRVRFPWLGFPWDPVKYRLKNAIKLADTLIHPDNVEWGYSAGPDALTRIVEGLNLHRHILPVNAFYPVNYADWARVLTLGDADFWAMRETSYAVHLWGEMYRRNGMDKGAVIRNAPWAQALLTGYHR